MVFYSRGNGEALFVPRSAVVTSTERKYVLLVRDGQLEKIDVSTGNATTSQIEVFGNIHAGDQVVMHATDEMPEGVAVKGH